MLETKIYDDDDEDLQENQPFFQQAGAPLHYHIRVHFPDWKGFILFPARLPDLTPLGYFLCDHLASKIYDTPPESL